VAGLYHQPLNIDFVNPGTGFVLFKYREHLSAPSFFRIHKTTNKGVNWSARLTDIHQDGDTYADIDFVDENNGILVWSSASAPSTIYTRYTTNGGINWSPYSYHVATIRVFKPQIKFINQTTGFLYDLDYKFLWKTLNRGNSWYLVSSNLPLDISDISVSPHNSDIIYLGGVETGEYIPEGPPYLIKSDNGFTTSDYTTLLNGGVYEDARGITKMFFFSNNEVKFSTAKGLYSFETTNNHLSLIYDYESLPFAYYKSFFSHPLYGFGYRGVRGNILEKNIEMTINGGNNWNITLPTYHLVYNLELKNIATFSQIAYFPQHDGQVSTRRIILNFNTNYDWRVNHVNGTIYMDNKDNSGTRTFTTPSENQFLRGGESRFSIPLNLHYVNDSTARFYYWGGDNGNLSMDPYGNDNYYERDGSFNADYKTKLKSTSIDALQNANQVKVLKDTNGVNNLIYESMGGIFFTRTKPSTELKAEEIVSGTGGSYVNGYATFGNSNPYLCEINGIQAIGSVTPERNIIACWERREEFNDNIKIMIAYRKVDEVNRPGWEIRDSILIQNAPPGFKCFPKMMVSSIYPYDHTVVTYLKPVSPSGVKLMARFKSPTVYGTPESELIPQNNIQEYAIVGMPSVPYSSNFVIYLAYRIGQSVYYKKSFAGYDLAGFRTYDIEPQVTVSFNDNSFWRASVDIALKNMNNSSGSINMQPVITYQGQYDTRITRDNGMGAPDIINAIYYPIYVKERGGDGIWYPSSIIYNSLNNVQFRPNIIGSKHNNSCIVSYGKTQSGVTKQYQVVPRWNATLPNQYVCYPNSVTALDAALLKGALVDNSSVSQNMMQLSLDAQVYKLEKNSFTVTDINNIEDANFEAVNGVVVNDDVRYSFNLGNIIVNSNSIGFSNDIDTVIDDTDDWNENMQSLPFLLSNNDTLIIGRNASYILDDPNGDVQEIEYWVKEPKQAPFYVFI